VYLVRSCIEKRRPRKLWEMILILPSSLDVLNTLLGIFGLLWIPASVWCVFRHLVPPTVAVRIFA
jgi:hypothetical protein